MGCFCVSGIVAVCEDFVPPPALPPNAVGNTLRLDKNTGGHVALTWDAPPADGGHDAATLYRVDRGTPPDGTPVEVGSATATTWLDVDELATPDAWFYLVHSENSGGSE